MKKLLCAMLCAVLLVSLLPPVQASADAQVGIHPERYLHNQRYDGCQIQTGIDVSQYQGQIDWSAVAQAGVEFAFIRIGGRYSSSGEFYDDTYFEENIAGAMENNIPVGVYFFSQATTPEEAEQEAAYTLKRLGDWADQLSLPVMLDMEYVSGSGRVYDADLSAENAANVALAFCDAIAEEGLDAGVYSGFVTYPLDGDALHDAGYSVWHAHWTDETTYTGWYDYWQVSSSGSVPGISGSVDVNFRYLPGSESADFIQSLYLSDETQTLTVGQSLPLAAAYSPDTAVDSVRWSSSDPTVAYVNPADGTVTAFSPGVTTITAYTGNGVEATCTITVEESDEASGDNTLLIASADNQVYAGGTVTTSVVVTTADGLAGATAVTTAQSLNVRCWPSVLYAPVATLPYGTPVTIRAAQRIGDTVWCAIEAQSDDKTLLGYVSAEYLTDISGAKALTEGVDYTLTYSGNTQAGTALVTTQATRGGQYQGTSTASFRLYDWAYLYQQNSASILAGKLDSVLVSGIVSGRHIYGWAAQDGNFLSICQQKDGTYTLLRNNRLYQKESGRWTVSIFGDAAQYTELQTAANAQLIAGPFDENEKISSVTRAGNTLTVTTDLPLTADSPWAQLCNVTNGTLRRIWTLDETTLLFTACQVQYIASDDSSRNLGSLTITYGGQGSNWDEVFALVHPDDTTTYTIITDPGTEEEQSASFRISDDARFCYVPADGLDGPYADTAAKKPAEGQLTQYLFRAITFDDVAADSWYYDCVTYAVSQGLFNGVSDTLFDPNGQVTREMFVTVLYRLAGAPETENDTDFTDVPAASWYHDAVAWAASAGVVNGNGDGTFGVGQRLTREQMAALLYRYGALQSAPSEVSTVTFASFSDADSVSDWAAEAMSWAVAEGLLNGTSETTLGPQDPSTRAQAAAVLQRYMQQAET